MHKCILVCLFISFHLNSGEAALFSLEPNSSSFFVEYDTPYYIVPVSHPGFTVRNLGEATIFIEPYYGTAVQWLGPIQEGQVLKPRENTSIDIGSTAYLVTSLRVHNLDTQLRALFYASRGKNRNGYDYTTSNSLSNYFSFNKFKAYELIESILALSIPIQEITIATKLFSKLLTLWSERTNCIWIDVKEHVQDMLNRETADHIIMLSDQDLMSYQKQLEFFNTEFKNGRVNSESYMQIFWSSVGFEEKFIIQNHPKSKLLNFVLLPMYTSFINLQVGFCLLGIRHASYLNLSNTNVQIVKDRFENITTGNTGAIRYVTDMYTNMICDTYNTAAPEYFFNSMMNTRSYIALHGLEYIDFWKALWLADSNSQIYLNTLVYSHFYGRTTPNLDATAMPGSNALFLEPPLTPSFVRNNSTGNYTAVREPIKSVQILFYDSDSFISGLDVCFKEACYQMGSGNRKSERLYLEDLTISKIEVGGGSKIDCLVFHISDGRKEFFGNKLCSNITSLELKGHHVVGIYLANDDDHLKVYPGNISQAANIAVAFQFNNSDVTWKLPPDVDTMHRLESLDFCKSKDTAVTTFTAFWWIFIAGSLFAILSLLFVIRFCRMNILGYIRL